MPINIRIQPVSLIHLYQIELVFTTEVSFLINVSNSISILYESYKKALPSIYQWENHFPEKKENLTFLGPDWFKEPPKHYALAPNWPRENYGPLNVVLLGHPNILLKYVIYLILYKKGSNRLLASKGYVPHFTKYFLDHNFN